LNIPLDLDCAMIQHCTCLFTGLSVIDLAIMKKMNFFKFLDL